METILKLRRTIEPIGGCSSSLHVVTDRSAKPLKTDYISRVTRIVGHRLIVDYWPIVSGQRRISPITDA